MFRLSSIAFILFFVWCQSYGQSPHGTKLTLDCIQCHSPESWSYNSKSATFDHNKTEFPLLGQHKALECKSCHKSLEFDQAESDCISCHVDMHQQTVGTDCARCHTPESWIVSNITEMHERTSFPLIGVHATVDCNQCHQSESQIRFSPTGMECIDCHRSDFQSTTQPNHQEAGFTEDCASCHTTLGSDWGTDKVDHSFFPLTKGHDIDDCKACHTGATYSDISPDCISCHQTDYNDTENPNHGAAGFTVSCTECHTTDPDWQPARFTQHDALYFPIYSGKHQGVWTECIECHTNPNNFAQFTCVSCHMNPETDYHHDGVTGYVYSDEACLACHPTGDADQAFDHNLTDFPLTGAHIGVDCIECHANGYIGTSTACVDCHTDDFNASVNPNHNALGIPTDCATCHTTDPGWQPARFDIHDQYYALNGAHNLIRNDCATCHNGDYNNTPNTCVGCHQSDFNGTTDPNHVTGQFSTECIVCHNEVAWEPSVFDHNTVYPLTGAHAAIANDCAACHINGNFENTPNTCVGCHQGDYEASTNPNHVTNQFSTDCIMCHNNVAWSPSNFDHNIVYPLNGAHALIADNCTACHLNGNFNNTPNTCVGCHQSDYEATTDPNHVVGQFSTNCAVCHNETAWEPSVFDHDIVYPLTGAHAVIANDCAACHINNNYSNTPNTCAGCHQNDYDATTNPNHTANQFSTECITCHNNVAWMPADFDHNIVYPLNGAHALIADNCAACHQNGNYNNTPNICVGCHQSDFDATTNPNHITSQFSTNCVVCHSETAWEPANFDHNTVYPLTGAHATIANDCVACHINNQYENTPSTCVGCHQSDYNATTDPNHSSNQFSTDCITCHNNTAWSPSTFDHTSVYPLTGAHANIANNCTACHINGNFNNTPNTCVGCHQDDYNGATNPNHSSNQFSTDCIQCHNNVAWEPATFDHNIVYPLTGAHANIADNCTACHINGNYNNTPNTCVGCHQADYNATTDPNHSTNQFSTDCITCHNNVAWVPSTFDHNITYPLTGAHANIANNCVACHVNGNYNTTPNTCVGCHQDDYNATTDPNHSTNQFSTDCITCHNNVAWVPSTFDHNAIFPFVGAHIAIQNNCIACHLNGNYDNTPNTCYGCHQQDYNGTNNPDHEAAMFPIECLQCHTQNTWVPSTFDHDDMYFPIYSGKHDGEWNQCIECHTNPNNFSQFDCLNCHNNQSELIEIHEDVNDYQYNSNACFACHPDGED